MRLGFWDSKLEIEPQPIDYVFCFTGHNSSRQQSVSEHMAVVKLMNEGLKIGAAIGLDPDIFDARNLCLRGSGKTCEKDQKPFEGVYSDYRASIWLDSDNYIEYPKIKRLLSFDVDIVFAWCRVLSDMTIGDDNWTNCSVAKEENGKTVVEHIKVREMYDYPRNDKGLIEVDFCGMALGVIKKGVFEKIGYPWFHSWLVNWVEDGVEMVRKTKDDESFCVRAKWAGFKIYVDPVCRIPHEKRIPL